MTTALSISSSLEVVEFLFEDPRGSDEFVSLVRSFGYAASMKEKPANEIEGLPYEISSDTSRIFQAVSASIPSDEEIYDEGEELSEEAKLRRRINGYAIHLGAFG